MYIVLGDLLYVYVLVYLDDILIYSATIEDYTRNSRAVFEWLAKSKFYLKYKKCALFLPEVEFLGNVVFECRL